MDVIGHAADGDRAGIVLFEDSAEILVELRLDLRKDQRLALVGAVDEMKEDARQGLCHDLLQI
jgi:hypothetical protein